MFLIGAALLGPGSDWSPPPARTGGAFVPRPPHFKSETGNFREGMSFRKKTTPSQKNMACDVRDDSVIYTKEEKRKVEKKGGEGVLEEASRFTSVV